MIELNINRKKGVLVYMYKVRIIKRMLFCSITSLFIFSYILGQNDNLNIDNKTYSISSERYVTDNNGNILMHVNIWGHVNNPGHHLVYDGIDLADDNIGIKDLRSKLQDFHDNEKYVTACNYCKGRGYGYGTIKAAIQTKKPLPINQIPN